MSQFIFEKVSIWNAEQIQEAQSVLVDSGQVRAIGRDLKADGEVQRIDGQNYALMPLGVDCQVHLRVPGQPEKETAATGLLSAKQGGFGAVLTMPNTQPVIDCVEVCRQAREELQPSEKSTGVEAFLSAAITQGQKGHSLVDMESLAKWGVSAFTDDGVGVASDELMCAAFEQARAVDLPILQHAECPGHGGVLAPGPTQEAQGITPYSDEPEWKMVARDLELLRKVPGARYHVLHISSHRTVELIRRAKEAGLMVTAEVTPHHLWFTAEDIPVGNSAYKMNPPLRGVEDRAALRAGLADGTIDFVSTDHAPHEAQAKPEDFAKAAFGTTGLEASLRVLLQLCREGELTPRRLVEVFSSKPAAFLSIQDSYGKICTERELKAVLVDVNAAPSPIGSEDLFSLSKNSCFYGTPFAGKITGLFNRGQFESFDPKA